MPDLRICVHIDYGVHCKLTNAAAYSYAFDDIDNRSTAAERGTNFAYTANALNQYTNISCGSSGSWLTPTFDLDGNRGGGLGTCASLPGNERRDYAPASRVADPPMSRQAGIPAARSQAGYPRAFSGSSIAAANPFRFSSEYHDDTLGLVYYNYRHYNPADGRWTSRDPLCENKFKEISASQSGVQLRDLSKGTDIVTRVDLEAYVFICNVPINAEDRLGMVCHPPKKVSSVGYSPLGNVAEMFYCACACMVWDDELGKYVSQGKPVVVSGLIPKTVLVSGPDSGLTELQYCRKHHHCK